MDLRWLTRIEQIRQKIAADTFEYSKHAVDQSIARDISVQELREAISTGEKNIMNTGKERFVERLVRYTLEYDGRIYIVESVPARVDEETGEQFFAPSTVERLREVVLGEQKPDRVIETPVYTYRERAA
jgi:hypothetical protein